MENIKNTVEAIIFSSGSPIEKKTLCEKIPELTTQQLNSIVKDLQKKYADDCGILLVEFGGKLQFTSNPKYGETVADILTPLREKELTKTLLEVLSTIAYKQPITRLEIDDMRGGTNSEYALSALLKAGLIEPVGRKEAVGRPFMYGTTDEFLKKFQIETLQDLPDLEEVMQKIQLIYAPTQENLFHSRTLYDKDGNLLDDDLEDVAADIDTEKPQLSPDVSQIELEMEDDELPDFLKDETVEVID
ncbi:MAG: SMC-Scp complex subunit ScpB [Clostridia bacterium]